MQDLPSFPYFKSDLTATAVLVKTGSIRMETLEFLNKDANQIFVQLFNKAAAADVTLGTTTPDLSYIVPPGDGTNYSATSKDFPKGLRFPKGLVIAATTTVAGSTASASNAIANITIS